MNATVKLPDWAVLQAQKEFEFEETAKLLAPILEPVPEPLILPPLTKEIVQYFGRIFMEFKRLGQTATFESIMKIVDHHNEVLLHGSSAHATGEPAMERLQYKLPPCEITLKEHVLSFVRLLEQKKEQQREQAFRDYALELMLDMVFPGTVARE